MISFKTIRARAAKRKGGEASLAALLPKVPSQQALARLTDDRVLAEMAKRIFSAGFVWSVIENKWPGFEAAFLGFDPKRLLFQPDEFWERLAADTRIVRNPQKIMAVRENAAFVADIAREHGSFGKFLAAVAGRRPGRAARRAGQARRAARRHAPASISCASSARTPSSRRTTSSPACAMPASTSPRSRPRGGTSRRSRTSSTPGRRRPACRYTHLSRICAMSIGENHDAETLRRRAAMDE